MQYADIVGFIIAVSRHIELAALILRIGASHDYMSHNSDRCSLAYQSKSRFVSS
jgi:hypothetical protein